MLINLNGGLLVDGIRNLCKDMCFNRVYNWNCIPKMILSNSVNSLGFDEDKLVLFYDSSALETGRTGIAICDDGIYWKDISKSPGKLSWDRFLNTEIYHDDHYIYFGDDEGIFAFRRDIELLVELLTTIKNSGKGDIKADRIIKVF